MKKISELTNDKFEVTIPKEAVDGLGIKSDLSNLKEVIEKTDWSKVKIESNVYSPERMTLEELIERLNAYIGLDNRHTVVAVFKNNESDNIIGWTVVEKGVDGDYPVMQLDELIDKYKMYN